MAVKSDVNYAVGGLDIYFDPTIGHASLLDTTATTTVGSNFRTAARSLGNIVTSEITPEVTFLDHYITVNGSRRKDKTVNVENNITIPFTFDELDEANFKRVFLGSTLGTGKTALMMEPLQRGSVSLLFRSQTGNDFVISIPKATLRPSGSINFGDGTEWNQISCELSVEFLSTTSEWASKPYGILNMI
jgi:hypothetical protein